MARHAAIEAPHTALLPVIEPRTQPVVQDLGLSAVHAARHADLLADNAHYFAHTGDPHLAQEIQLQADAEYAAVGTMLEEVRGQIAAAPDSRIAEDYLRPFLGTAFVAAKARGAQHDTILRWLADREHGASDAQLLNFTADHLDRLLRHRHNSEDMETIRWAKADYVAKVQDNVTQKRYDPQALKTLERVKDAEVVIGDVWDTHIIGRNGYYLWGRNFVVVGQRVYADEAAHDEMHQTVIHELDHLQFPLKKSGARWRTEAQAEHNTQSLVHGQWEEFDPDNRQPDSKIYYQERRLMGILLTQGRRVIPADVATRAHTGPQHGRSKAAFNRALEESWTPDTPAWVDARVAQLTEEYEGQGHQLNTAQSMAAKLVGDELLDLVNGMRSGMQRKTRP